MPRDQPWKLPLSATGIAGKGSWVPHLVALGTCAQEDLASWEEIAQPGTPPPRVSQLPHSSGVVSVPAASRDHILQG